MLELLDKQFDKVIRSAFITAKTSYDFALNKLVPLIDRFEQQRNPLRATFYKRLEKDILNGCIMPPLTVAIKASRDYIPDISSISEEYILKNLENAFILDGIQRLSTLKRIQHENNLDLSGVIYLNILICDSMDRLLYRMITLNNGQRPMSARHQIEILASNIFDFDKLPILLISEKQQKNKKKTTEESMSKEVVIKGYMAFSSNSINIDNQKIIESKMNELVAEEIMDSDLTSRNVEFIDVMDFINNCLASHKLGEWFQVANNFIGFSAAMGNAFNCIKHLSPDNLEDSINLFEEAFSSIDVSKIKLGQSRRRMVKYFFENYSRLSVLSSNKLLNEISQEI